MRNELVIPSLLKAFIEKGFKSMLKEQRKLEEGREKVLPKLKAKEQREHKQDKRAQRKTRDRRYYTWYAALKGKDKHCFNLFVGICDHLIQKQNKEVLDQGKLHRKDVHEWISDFLFKKNFYKGNKNQDALYRQSYKEDYLRPL